MIREAPAMTVRQNLGELLNEVQYRGDSVVITKGGKPVLATSIASSADMPITGERDLLALRDNYPIESPSEFVRRL